ncbi:hypothetical protein Q3G72_015604 [Acer saccharum]|nr:hypothetical protein Q3G72_015604 [Acer saccharum]
MGRARVIAALIAANQRLHTHDSLSIYKEHIQLYITSLRPWKLAMSLKQQKMQEEQVLLKPFSVQMLLESRNTD